MRHLLVLVLAVAVAPLAAAAAAQATPVMPISTDACPGFAQTYPDDYLLSAITDFGFLPAGAYIAPGDDQGTISFRRLGSPNGIRWAISVRGLTAPGEAPNGSPNLPTLTAFASYSYTIRGELTTPPDAPAGPVSGDGPVQIVRSDGARMWGQGGIVRLPHASGVWDLAVSSVHCSLG
jgi:hypothetical protein